MKYIDSEKLYEYLEQVSEFYPRYADSFLDNAVINVIKGIKTFVTSLQQEQPEVQNGKFVFPKYLYARTKDNKTIDMSYAPQDMTAIEYIRNDFVEQEQP